MSARAVFLDRDGTIIAERHYLSDPDQVELLPGVAHALSALQQLGLKLVVITNQSAIGRGILTLPRLRQIHERLEQFLAGSGVRLDGIYYCPHAPADACSCRKPQPGLIERAAQELRLDPGASFVIGDKPCDLEMGRRVGARTFLVRTGYGARVEAECAGLADYAVEEMGAAVPVIAQLLTRAPATTLVRS